MTKKELLKALDSFNILEKEFIDEQELQNLADSTDVYTYNPNDSSVYNPDYNTPYKVTTIDELVNTKLLLKILKTVNIIKNILSRRTCTDAHQAVALIKKGHYLPFPPENQYTSAVCLFLFHQKSTPASRKGTKHLSSPP